MADWQPGDLALCVKAGKWRAISGRESCDGPRRGSVCAVVGVHSRNRATYLELAEWPGEAFAAHPFRRIPPHTPDAEDAETIRLLTGAPVTEDA